MDEEGRPEVFGLLSPVLLLPMPAPLYVRPLSTEEQAALDEALCSDIAFTLRRAQILRLSAQGKRSGEIAEALGCWPQTVRNAIHDFNDRSTASLQPKKSGPKDPERIFDEEKQAALLELAHQSPRTFSKNRSTWTLELDRRPHVEEF